ncbi:MFS general substrate transporter [Mycena maculata]|uniref:MFS general substrate transporter n=1 Tax=Mycena maculata TaxID=230809 RepID=A0AAD7KD82_9AGAR|nr:MFS general substrate transporter [Mycena maculata]
MGLLWVHSQFLLVSLGHSTSIAAMTSTILDDKPEMGHLEATMSGSTDDPKTAYDGNGNGQSWGDAAQAILGNNAHVPVIVSAEDNARILRKTDLWLLPVMLGVYFLQQLDKSTLAYASVFNLAKNTGLVGYQYSALGSIVYAAQLIWQPVSSFLLVRLPVGRWLAFNVLLWGITLSCMTTAKKFSTLLASRFFLGIFEATVAPTFVTITAMWWRRREQTQRTSLWYSMNGLTTVVGSILSFGLGHIKSSTLESYQIIFLFTGLLTVAFSLVVFLVLPNSPTTARFFTHEEKILAVERLRANNMGTETKVWKWSQARECLLDPKTWAWFSMIFLISIPSGGISTFGPLIIESFGYNQLKTVLLQMPFGAVQIFATLLGGFAAAHGKLKFPVLVALTLPPIAGAAALLKIPRTADSKGALLGAYYIVSFYPGISPLIYTWSSQNTAGHTKKTLTTGVLFVGQSAGNILGPFLYTTAQAPLYKRGLTSSLGCFAALASVFIGTAFYLALLNRSHAKRRTELGKTGTLVDASLERTKDAAAAQEANGSQFAANAFDDLTDTANEDFIYVL